MDEKLLELIKKDKRIKELENMFKELIEAFCKAIDVFLNKQKK